MLQNDRLYIQYRKNRFDRFKTSLYNPDRLADASDIARSLGVSSNILSRPRAYLIDHGIIAAPERGKVMFCIPYLADYVKKNEQVSDAITVARQRKV